MPRTNAWGQGWDNSSRPSPRPRTKFWPRGQLVLEDLTSLDGCFSCLELYEYSKSFHNAIHYVAVVRFVMALWIVVCVSVKSGVEAGNPRCPWDVWRLWCDTLQRSLDVWKVWLRRVCRLLPCQAGTSAVHGASSRVSRVDDMQRQSSESRARLTHQHPDHSQWR